MIPEVFHSWFQNLPKKVGRDCIPEVDIEDCSEEHQAIITSIYYTYLGDHVLVWS